MLWVFQQETNHPVPKNFLRTASRKGYLSILKHARNTPSWRDHTVFNAAIQGDQTLVIDWLQSEKVPMDEDDCVLAIKHKRISLFKYGYLLRKSFMQPHAEFYYLEAWKIRDLSLLQFLYEHIPSLFDKQFYIHKTGWAILEDNMLMEGQINNKYVQNILDELHSIMDWIRSIL
jgi:hypothetical protein